MEIFLDTAQLSEIERLMSTGLVQGITTNPSLVGQQKRPFRELIAEICTLVPEGPVSAEVIALDTEGMVMQGRELAAIAPNVVVKLPVTPAGLKACYILSQEDIATNLTLCFTPMQALLAANAGATFISPFIGRLEDINQDGMQLIEDIVTLYTNQGIATQILAASIRQVDQVTRVAMLGVDAVTISPKIFEQLHQHPLTDQGLERFVADWQASGLEF